MVIEDPRADQTAALTAWLGRHAALRSHRFAVVLPTGAQLPMWIDHAITMHVSASGIAQQTITSNGPRWALNFLRTLKRRPRWATTAREPWAGLPAFVVGAGSSLDRNGHLLREAQKRGPIIAVNSSAACCLHHGVRPDVVVCCEAVDLREHLTRFAGSSTLVVLDAIASQHNWDAAGDNAAAIVLHEPYVAPYALELGAMPLHYSTSSTTAAAALAVLWGASPIVMVGQDNGTTGGKPYADGSPFADLRAAVVDGVLHYAGASKAPYRVLALMRPSWGGGEPTPSDQTFSGPLAWYEQLGERNVLINATEGGAAVVNAFEEPLAACVARYRESARKPIELDAAADTAPVLDRIRAAAQDVLARGLREPPPSFRLLHMWTVPALIASHPARWPELRVEATQRGAREILEVLS